MDRVRAGDLGSGDDAVGLEIAVLARAGADADRLVGELDVHGIDIRLGINRHRMHAEFAAGADDAKRDLAAVGDQDFVEHVGRVTGVI